MKIRSNVIIFASITLLGRLFCAPSVVAQDVDLSPRTRAPAPNRVSISDHRLMIQFLTKAKESFRKNDYAQGLVFTQRILDGDEDFFIDDEGEFHTSLKHQTLQLLANLPIEGRRMYELEHGANAQQNLADAIILNSIERLEEITRRFFHTKAGYEATYQLGTYYLDRSQPLTAGIYFERLRKYPQAASKWEPMLSLKTALCWSRAGMQEESVRTLIELKTANPKGTIILGGQQVPLFDDKDRAIDWLANIVGQSPEFTASPTNNWPMFRGNPGRNAVSSQAVPVWETSWQFDTIREPWAEDPKPLELIKAQLNKLTRENRNGAGNFLMFPAAHPLIIEDTVIFRTLRNIKAVSLSTGELIWETAVTDLTYTELQKQGNSIYLNRGTFRESALDAFLKERTWQDLTVGTLSSDGRFIFTLEKQGFLGPNQSNLRVRGQNPFAPNKSNRLLAFELDTGRFLWEIGGPRNEYELDFAGMFFLGPPLPYRDRLYCLAEESGEIRLLVFRPVEVNPGRWQVKLDWSQGIANSDPSPTYRGRRRLAGISPSLSNGILICPTISGSVVAIDLARRLLLWKYDYRNIVNNITLNRRAFLMARAGNIFGVDNADAESRWIDSVPTIAEGSVLLTPRDSNELHCLKLADGSLMWKKPRDQGLYLATIHNGKAIVVERSQLQALDLADGKFAWKQPTPMSLPSGRGFRSGDLYRIPLTTGEIATVDLNTGRVLARSKSPNGEIPGNLVVAGRTLVSQSSNSVIGFRSFDELNRQIITNLDKNSEDAEALTLRGEIRLHLGREEEGLADLRRAFDLKPSSRTRHLLVDRLLEGVRTDFAKYRESTEEIAKLVKDPRQRSTFLRLYAAGLQSMGERRAAFSEYLKLAGPDTGEPTLERISGIVSVRSDRWVRARIADLYAEAKPDERKSLDAEIETQLEIAKKQNGPQALRKFLNYFEQQRVAAKARRMLLERLDEKQDTLELELQLQQMRNSDKRETAGYATARLVQLLVNVDRASEANNLLDELQAKWGDIVCLNNKTGKELVDEWRADKTIGNAAVSAKAWLDGRVDVAHTKRNAAIKRHFPVEIIGPRSSYFEGWTLNMDQRRQFVIARNENGLEQWRFSTDSTTATLPNVYGNYAFFHGHLLVLVLGNRFVALDTFGSEESPKLLWERQLYDDPASQGLRRNVRVRQFVLPGGIRRFNVMDPRGRPMGRVGIVNNHLICYQVGTNLYAAETLTGRILWVRGNIARGSEIFGDDQSIFVSDPVSGQSLALKTADGEIATVRPLLPSPEQRLTTHGRHVLTWKLVNKKRRLALNDALTDKLIWQAEFAEPSAVSIIGGNEIAVLATTGEFLVLRIEDGQPILKSKTKPQPKLTNIIVFRSQERYVLLTTVPPQNQNALRPIGIGINNPIVNGWSYGFDRKTGQRIWETKIEKQAVELNQPKNLPVLIFTCRLYQPPRVGGARIFNQNQYSILILDKRNGQVVYKSRGPQAISTFELTSLPKQQKIDVGFYRSLISLQFTNEPPSKPEKPTEIPKNNSAAKKPSR